MLPNPIQTSYCTPSLCLLESSAVPLLLWSVALLCLTPFPPRTGLCTVFCKLFLFCSELPRLTVLRSNVLSLPSLCFLLYECTNVLHSMESELLSSIDNTSAVTCGLSCLFYKHFSWSRCRVYYCNQNLQQRQSDINVMTCIMSVMLLCVHKP